MSGARLQLDDQHKLALLAHTYRLAIVLLLLGLLLSLAVFDRRTVVTVVLALLLTTAGEWLARRGHLRAASRLLLGLLLVLVTALALIGEANSDASVMLFGPAMVLAGLIASQRGFWWYAGAVAVALLLLGVAEHSRWVTPWYGQAEWQYIWPEIAVLLIAHGALCTLIHFVMHGVGQFVVSVRDELEQETLSWHKAAMTDVLTGLLNRRGFLEHAEWQIRRAKLDSAPIAVLMLDLDHFKQINDQHGHAVGDQVLQETGQRLQRHLRANDASGRLGGEEFCALLTGAGAHDAELIAQRFCSALAGAPFITSAGLLSVTLSIGICAGRAGEQSLVEMMQRADHALYVAKSNGRNQVVMTETAPVLVEQRQAS